MKNVVISGIFAALAATSVQAQDDAVNPAAAVAGDYKTDKGHAYITFSYDHQGYSKPYLRWRDWDGELSWDPENPTASVVDVTINAASIDSGVDVFDGHLKEADFFDVENHPTITFKSTSLTTTGETTGTMIGNLTIKGVTKPVTLNVTLNRAAEDNRSNGHKLGFSAKTTVKRSDFGIDKYAPFVSDEVDVIIETEFVKPGA